MWAGKKPSRTRALVVGERSLRRRISRVELVSALLTWAMVESLCSLDDCWCENSVSDQLLDFLVAHDTLEMGAWCWLAWAGLLNA